MCYIQPSLSIICATTYRHDLSAVVAAHCSVDFVITSYYFHNVTYVLF